MENVLFQMAALILCGVAWRVVRPLDLDADSARRTLTGLVYVLLLPALVIRVLWQAPLGIEAVQIAIIAAATVVVGLLLSWSICRLCSTPKPVAGALLLAAAFPNATYMGLPVLTETLGEWASRIAIQYDLFACTPLLLTVGILIARRHGENTSNESMLRTLLTVPPLWAAAAAVTLNLGSVPFPAWLEHLLNTMGMAVIPLMLIALGMGLRWDTWRPAMLPKLIPILLIQLLIQPLLALWLADLQGLQGEVKMAIVLEAAMPSMVLGIVLADRYKLDTGLYAAAVTLSTAVSLVTLPLWFSWLA
ncbi:transporter [Solemya pervernicosa gill symbiont]|uniref:Transporter n=2 Tax=Gammaproteobacteria incertae sedis TaxID=118884 RepID=A0A1T2L3L9_9GAMM|nr:AEC family transporter [Candidatus Reidiella endopervernicosa]OOZ39662.1 transporter [Solemya pervernicosa gill symbiont]QKQ27749.1 AEC family transporter [Candidatus Reidiella endopervernicosa]